MEIKELERQIEQTRAELHAENQRGALRDSNKVAELQTTLDDLSQRLEVELRLAETKVHEQRVEESHEEIAYILDTMKAGDNTMRDLTINESAYQILREVVQLTMMERDEKYLEEIKKIREENAVLAASKESLQDQYNTLYENFANVKSELNTAKAELEDAELKRDSAASQLDEAKKEIERLNGRIDDLRTEIEVGASDATKIVQTNVNSNLAELVQKFNASKPAIYDVEALDHKQSRFRAKLAATGEEIEFGYLEKGKYREVTAEEAEVFRAEYEAKQAAESATVDTGEGLELAEQFQEDAETTADGLVEGDVNGEMAAKTVEERLQALEVAVFGRAQEVA